MHPRQAVPPELLRLAAYQDRVVSREQALGLGLGRHALIRLLGEEAWRPLTRGVYCTDPAEPDWRSWAWAGLLVGGDEARLGGAAAGHLHGIIEEPPAVITVLVPGSGGRPRIAGPWDFRREQPGMRRPGRGSPPRTGVEDTLLDLAATAELDDLIGWIGRAVQLRRTTPDRLRAALVRRPRMPRRKLLGELLDDAAAGARSPLEQHYLRDVERAHGLPIGTRQATLPGSEIDVWYQAYGLLVELDGHRGHDGAGRFRDLRRDNRSTGRGLATLRYGYGDVVGSPCRVAHQLAANLALRGWPGPLTPCEGCRAIMPVNLAG
ncbi:type IV toxin-antitoxin system AbiEi family antitoxin domain-containing protein [Microlunatus speluncae]|uniref:type IV toxin-antitoxin system AbiEi family antitoxin domain-containing protein n=1 Tax=Microlunatus speluncae TaxID=2594267 RepID=UPI00126608CC|nr:type IV toxin-antitoxin system AbiEi family antitoxin domain-containing protein [Microlunatus speluncae]